MKNFLIIIITVAAIGGILFYLVSTNVINIKKIGVPAPSSDGEPSATSTVRDNLDSGVMGIVMSGPTCPVQRVGDTKCADRPYQAKIVITKLSGELVTTIQTDANANFKIRLEPGTYFFKGENETGGILPRCNDKEINVEPHQFAMTTIFCDTRIR